MGDDAERDLLRAGRRSARSGRVAPIWTTFRSNDLEVLYLVDPIDGFMISMLREYDGKTLRNIDDAGLELPEAAGEAEEEAPAVEPEELDALLARFKTTLDDRVVDVRASKQLVYSPCRLVSTEDSFDRDLERLRRLMEEDYEVPKKILEINRKHSLVANLAHLQQNSPDDPLIDPLIEQLFANAQLLGWCPTQCGRYGGAGSGLHGTCGRRIGWG